MENNQEKTKEQLIEELNQLQLQYQWLAASIFQDEKQNDSENVLPFTGNNPEFNLHLIKAGIDSSKEIIIFLIDTRFQYLYFNQLHYEVMKKAYGTVVKTGLNMLDCIPDNNDKDKIRRNFERVLAGDFHSQVEEFGVLERSYWETRYNPVYDNNGLISGISVFSVNVNTRIKTENLLRESSKRFKTAIDNFPYEFIILNPDFRILYMNKLGLKRINAAFHDIVGHSLNDADWNEIASQCQSIQNEVIREKRTIHRNIETGSPENLQIYKITYVPVLNDNKEIREIFRILIDITQISQNESRLRALSNQLEKMREEERHRISRDIHDDLGQILTALKIDLVSLQKKSGANHEFHDEFGPIIGLVDAAIDSARRVSFELRPGILDQTGLIPAVEWLINQSKKHSRMEFQISLPETGILEIDTEKSVAIYRILQEILTNISRHADATKVNISLTADGKTVKLLVSDNGKGFDFDSHAESLGILGIKERARMQNGTLVVQSQPMEGTFISLTIPYS